MTAPAWPPGILIADHATTADRHGTCALCDYAILAGQRVARLLDGSGWAHITCIAAMAPGRQAAAGQEAGQP